MQISERDGGRRLVIREYRRYDPAKGRSVMAYVCSIPLHPTVPDDVPANIAEKFADRPDVLAEIRARLADLRPHRRPVKAEEPRSPEQVLIQSMVSLILVATGGVVRYASQVDSAVRAEVVTGLLLALDQLGFKEELQQPPYASFRPQSGYAVSCLGLTQFDFLSYCPGVVGSSHSASPAIALQVQDAVAGGEVRLADDEPAYPVGHNSAPQGARVSPPGLARGA